MSLVKRETGGLLASKSASGAVGKGMVVAGASTVLLSFLAALIPFVGVLGIGVVVFVLGIMLAE
jgi:hypothetical protein